jgi:hypothetical protein
LELAKKNSNCYVGVALTCGADRPYGPAAFNIPFPIRDAIFLSIGHAYATE